MTIEELQDLLDRPEDDHHDFKQAWYPPKKMEEFVKDIFSFVNVTHHDDCFLIIGVNDKTLEVTGVEEDPNRKNQQNIVDFLHSLPISGEYIPQVRVEIIKYFDGHEVDVLRIVNTNNVPVFLNERWNSKGNKSDIEGAVQMGEIYTKDDIRAKQVFVREADVNTARTDTAEYHQVEQLWRKHFRLDQPILERYRYVLQDVENWSYFENDEIGFLYNLNPDFNMILTDRDDADVEVDSFSINFFNPKMSWQNLALKFRQITIASLPVGSFDSANLTFVIPDVTSPESFNNKLFYRYFIEDSLKADVQNLLTVNGPNTVSHSDILNYNSNIVWYQTDKEKNIVNKLLDSKLEMLANLVQPTSDEINSLRENLKIHFPIDSPELTTSAVTSILTQSKTGSEIKKIVAGYRMNPTQLKK